MKILHLISSGGMYGAEAVILNLSRTLAGQGHASALGVFGNAAQPNLELLARAAGQGLEAHTVPCAGSLDRGVPAALRALLRQIGAEVVHAHGYKADVYAGIAFGLGKRRSVPLVSTCHTWYDNTLPLRLYGALDRAMLRRFSRVIAVSAEVKARLLRAEVQPERIRLIRNGIDLRPFAAAAQSKGLAGPSKPLRIGLVGRLAPEKGVDVFLRAAAQVHRALPETRFTVIGEGPERAPLERLTGELRLHGIASLPGRGEDMPALYAGLDLLVSASRQEGLPIALLEGLASGLPLAATAVGEVPTLIEDGVSGVLVPPADEAALAAAIIGLLQDPARRLRLGLAGRERVAHAFSVERMAVEYLEVYTAAWHEMRRRA